MFLRVGNTAEEFMKTIYLECTMGAAGDMLAAALLELHPDRAGFLARINGAGIPGVEVGTEQKTRCGIVGTHISVRVHGKEEGSDDAPAAHHAHQRGIEEIGRLVSSLRLPPEVLSDLMAVYRLLAEAESTVHREPLPEIHFHELGMLDAVADIACVSLLLHELAPERVLASPVCVGSGEVRCAHGILPVPAPATALLLRGIPIYSGTVRQELCTPTGAALLKYFASGFGPMPEMRVSAIGCGMGARDTGTAGCLRSFFGES